ncbi:hypothetical protein D3C85_1092180 [compost metagenome]
MILESIPFAPLVLLIGELMDSVIIDQSKVPENTYTGYGIPVSVKVIVPDSLKTIQINAVVRGVINAQTIPKYD